MWVIHPLQNYFDLFYIELNKTFLQNEQLKVRKLIVTNLPFSFCETLIKIEFLYKMKPNKIVLYSLA